MRHSGGIQGIDCSGTSVKLKVPTMWRFHHVRQVINGQRFGFMFGNAHLGDA